MGRVEALLHKAWRIVPAGTARVVGRSVLGTILLAAAVLCVSCGPERQEATEPAVIESGIESPVPVLFTIGSTLYRSGPQVEVAAIAQTESDQIAESGLWAGARAFYYISPGPSPVLRRLSPERSDETIVASGAVHVVATAEDGSFVCLEEDGETPLTACLYGPAAQEPDVLAESVGELACDSSMNRFCYTTFLEPDELESPVAVVARGDRGADARVVRVLGPAEGATIAAVSEERVLFLVHEDATQAEGELFEYDFESGETFNVAARVRCLAADEQADRLVLATMPDAGDPFTAQLVQATRSAAGQWDLMVLGEPVTDATLFAEFSNDGTRILAGEATLGQADRMQVFDLEGASLGDIVLNEGVALKQSRLSNDGESVVAITQEASGTGSTGIGPERLAVFDVTTGESSVLATSRIDQGGGTISIVGLPDDIGVWR